MINQGRTDLLAGYQHLPLDVLGKVVMEIATEELIIALQGADEDTREQVFRSLSGRTATVVRDELAFREPAAALDISQSQAKLLRALYRLEDQGEITLYGCLPVLELSDGEFRIESLAALSDELLNRVIAEVDADTLALALRDRSGSLIERVGGMLAPARAAALSSKMARPELAPLQRWIDAMAKVLDVVSRLDAAGERVIPPSRYVLEAGDMTLMFSDLARLSGADRLRLVSAVDSSVMAMALKGAGEALLEVLLGDLPAGEAGPIRHELASLGPVRVAEVEEAQATMLKLVLRWHERGELTWSE